MAKAIWNEHVIAESDNTVVVEGNHYFPPESVKSRVPESEQPHDGVRVEGDRPVLRPGR